MASNPPFPVEDQTDEDFFDKLVDNDDDEIKVIPQSVPNIADGSDSDEARAFANLSIGDVVPVSEDSSMVGEIEAKVGAVAEDVNRKSVDSNVEESCSLVPSSSIGFDSLVESTSESRIISNGIGSESSGVKEVQWSDFGADSEQDDYNGFGSYSDFFTKLENNNLNTESQIVSGSDDLKSAFPENDCSDIQYQDNQVSVAATDHTANGQDVNSSQYWENLYPGWKYDVNTGQWYQVDGYDANGNFQESVDSNSTSEWGVSDAKSEVSYLQQTASSVVGAVADSGTTASVVNWNQVSQESGTTESVSNWNPVPLENNGYPAHMVFDPQYPGWYYDTIVQEWRVLETHTSSVQSSVQAHDQLNQNDFASTGDFSQDNDQKSYSQYGQADNYGSQSVVSQGQDYNLAGSFSNYNQQSLNMWQPEIAAKNELPSKHGGNQQFENHYGSNFSPNMFVPQNAYDSRGTFPSYEKASEGHDVFTGVTGSKGFVPGGNFSQQFNQPVMEQNKQVHASDYYANQNSLDFSHQPFQTGHQVSYASNVGRSSAGRPPHALVTFGFGGKLIVMKESTLSSSSYATQDPVGSSISVLNLMEVVTVKTDASSTSVGACHYFHTLCRQSFPGPLVGGSVGGKELNKWIDERIAYCQSSEMDYRKGEVLRLLLSLLKIAYQHYGKLRSPFGNDTASKEDDAPESAVARLFASAKRNSEQISRSGALVHCLQNLPSEGQMRATASEVQSLLVSGRKKAALQCAQEGQLWGPALVLAAQLGDQFYGDTVKHMALRQLVAGSPLRTLCLLIAGQPADVFSTESTAYNGVPGAANMSQHPSQFGAKGMLDDWEENLAVIAANRTKDDELVLIHLGDCLWKERSEIIAAHICYLVAEANFEPFSDTARLCLIGADHWKFPRTFASPEAIQRTELYEYSKVLGNSQFILLPFQPYKLIYAHMLAEVGKVSESLKYCQAVSKSLKNGRAPEVDTWKQLVSSLEERIKNHQQGGYSTNLAPAKLVGKLLNLFDSTAHRVVGGLPPPAPSTLQSGVQGNEHYAQPLGPRVSTSQSTMAMSSLMPSASAERTSEWNSGGNKMTMHNRSVSEPDFGRTPRQEKAPGGASRFGRFSFGSQFLQKTVGLVLKSREDRQAKLGETNKFYYDEKLKRWVEEGVQSPVEEAALAPPPTAAAFQNGMSDYNLKSALRSEGTPTNGSPEYKSPNPVERSSGVPPIPPTSNQFSARGRMGVRSRYVDTFNQGGGNSTNLFQSPSVPSIKPTGRSSPNFFVPTPVSSGQQTFDPITENVQETSSTNENHSVSNMDGSFSSPPPSSSSSSSSTMPRFPSMDTITNRAVVKNSNGPLSSNSRRTASWSGSFSDSFSPPQSAGSKPLGEVLGMPPSSFMPSGTSSMHLPRSGSSFGDELHEVEL